MSKYFFDWDITSWIIFSAIAAIKFPLIFIPITIFNAIHFTIFYLQSFKFQQPSGNLYRNAFLLIAVPFLSITALYAYYSGLNIDAILNKETFDQSLPGLIAIPIAIATTIWLLLFSNFYLAKPLKETWKSILLAGIIAGLSSFALSYGLWKFVGPYLA